MWHLITESHTFLINQDYQVNNSCIKEEQPIRFKDLLQFRKEQMLFHHWDSSIHWPSSSMTKKITQYVCRMPPHVLCLYHCREVMRILQLLKISCQDHCLTPVDLGKPELHYLFWKLFVGQFRIGVLYYKVHYYL